MTGQGHAVVPARLPLRRLRGRSRTRRTGRGLLMNSAAWAIPGAVLVGLAVGAVRAVSHLLVETGWAIPGAPGRLFVVAAVLLLLGGLAQVLRSARPVSPARRSGSGCCPRRCGAGTCCAVATGRCSRRSP